MTSLLSVAVVQASPCPDSLADSLDKALGLITQAAREGARLIVLGESWLSGYPAWLDLCPAAALWDHPPTKEVYARMRRNSITVPGDATDALAERARELAVVVALGINERVERGPGHGTLYNSLLAFDADGRLALHRRKLVPTYTERLVWGAGDGTGLTAVDTDAGRLGGLICWEHWMPLARQALHDSGEKLHLALWPGVKEMHQIASRHYAFEGRCFVLAAGSILSRRQLPTELDPITSQDDLVITGGSAIIGPDGTYVVEPVFGREDILLAELDLAAIDRESLTLDVSGHYSRPDLFDFTCHKPTAGST